MSVLSINGKSDISRRVYVIKIMYSSSQNCVGQRFQLVQSGSKSCLEIDYKAMPASNKTINDLI